MQIQDLKPPNFVPPGFPIPSCPIASFYDNPDICLETKKAKFHFEFEKFMIYGCPIHGFTPDQVKEYGKNFEKIEKLALEKYGLDINWAKITQELVKRRADAFLNSTSKYARLKFMYENKKTIHLKPMLAFFILFILSRILLKFLSTPKLS